MKKLLLTALSFTLLLIADAQWQSQNAGFTKNNFLGFYEMSIVDKNTVWAVCYDGINGLSSRRVILDFTRTTDGGKTWIPGAMGKDSSLEFSNISAVSATEAWVAMHKKSGALGGGLYHTIDGGITWNQVAANEIFDANSFPDFVHFKDKNKGIAMGDPNGGSFEVYTTTNGGKKWKRLSEPDLPAPLANEYGWISGYTVVGNNVWFGTTSGRMYKSTDYGRTWQVHTVDPQGRGVFEIAFNDDQLHGVAHLRGGQTYLLATEDGGVTWKNLGQPAFWKSSRITAVPGTNAFVSTSMIQTNQGSAVSYDNGATWTELENIAPKAVARFLDPNTGWAGGFVAIGQPFGGGLFKSEIVFQTVTEDKPGNGKGHNTKDISRTLLQREKVADQAISVFPSPAKDLINVLLSNKHGNDAKEISLINMNGKVVLTKKVSGSGAVPLQVNNLPSGSYVLKVSEEEQTFSKLITIAR